VKYVVSGAMEKQFNDAAGFGKFNAMVQNGELRLAYQNKGTTIYEVVQDK